MRDTGLFSWPRSSNEAMVFDAYFDRSLPYWICKGCGQMLINPRVEAEDDVVWICDGCHQMLNMTRIKEIHIKG